MKLYSHLTLYVSCLCIVAGCSQREDSSGSGPAERPLSFVEEVVIKEGELVSGEFLSLPSSAGKAWIRTDREGHIYLPDRSSVTVRVFDAEGNFLHNIGKKGNGPREFSRIGAIDIFQDELIVYDGGNRRIVRFSTDGDFLGIHIPDGKAELYPETIHQLEEERYLFLRKLPDIEGNIDEGISSLSLYRSAFFHLYSPNHSYPRFSFGHIDSLMDAGSDFTQHYISHVNTGRVWIDDRKNVWFVPGIYDGRLFKFREQKGKDGWVLAETRKGYVLPQESIDLNARGEGTMQIVVYAPNFEVYSGKIQSQSLGIFTLKDGRLVHISSQLDGGERRTFVEVFNSGGELVELGRLTEFTFSGNEQKIGIRPFWKDREDRFYFIKGRRDSLVLIGGRIHGL